MQSISSAQAQKDHDARRLVAAVRKHHPQGNWRYCAACRKRLKREKILVDGQSI